MYFLSLASRVSRRRCYFYIRSLLKNGKNKQVYTNQNENEMVVLCLLLTTNLMCVCVHSPSPSFKNKHILSLSMREVAASESGKEKHFSLCVQLPFSARKQEFIIFRNVSLKESFSY